MYLWLPRRECRAMEEAAGEWPGEERLHPCGPCPPGAGTSVVVCPLTMYASTEEEHL